MLEFKNNLLDYSGEIIKDNDTIITLVTDLNTNPKICGQLSFTDGSSVLIEFTNFDSNIYKAKLSLSEDLQSKLTTSLFRIIIVSTQSKESNYIKLNFDLEKIKFSLKETKSADILKLTKDLAQLSETVNHLIEGHVLTNISLNNKDYIKKGMILQAIDDNGNFVAVYPFTNMVQVINGQKPINNSINLDASMIQYNQKVTIEEQLFNITQALEKLFESITSQGNLIKNCFEELNDLKQKFNKHINDGII